MPATSCRVASSFERVVDFRCLPREAGRGGRRGPRTDGYGWVESDHETDYPPGEPGHVGGAGALTR